MRALGKLKKLRGRSLEELRERAGQMLHARAERAGLSEQAREPSDSVFVRLLVAKSSGEPFSLASLHEHFRTGRAQQLSAAFDYCANAVPPREILSDGACARAVEAADRVVANRFDLLGLRGLDFGTPPDWHLEPVSGRRAPLAHWSRIAYLDPSVAGDKKVTWELNRHRHFLTLGRAYRYTGDERYARTFVEHISSWMDANPPKRGINWASSLEVAFRAVAWLWALHFFRESPHLDHATLWRIYKILYVHARHLETYLSTYFSPNTHLTGEALGLYYLGTLLPEFRRAATWRAIGKRVFLDTLVHHVEADGVYFERSTYYHRYTADFCLHFHILASQNGDAPNEEFVERLTKLLDHLVHITKPDGRTPYFGDDDGGRFIPLAAAPANDFRATLALGAALLGRADYKFVAQLGAPNEAKHLEEIYWLLGARGVEDYERLASTSPAATSRAFHEGGYYCLRDSWTDAANYLLLDCGAHGSLNYGHAHADALSFELAARGRTLLVDPGTYTYTAAAEERNRFRSSTAHNTLTIDDRSSSTPGANAFTWRSIAECEAKEWLDPKRFSFFAGEHDGYTRLDNLAPAVHRREILSLKHDYWVLRDLVTATSKSSEAASGDGAVQRHVYALHFHAAAGVAAHLPDPRDTLAQNESSIKIARLMCEGTLGYEGDAQAAELQIAAISNSGGAWRQSEGWVSEAYAARTPAQVLSFEAQAAHTKAPVEFVTFLMPYVFGEQEACVRVVEADSGWAFRIEREECVDLLLIASHEMPRVSARNALGTRSVSCDGGWCWLRLGASGRELCELVAVGARCVTLDDEEVLYAPKARYVSAQWDGQSLAMETDAVGAWRVARRDCGEVILNNNVPLAAGSNLVCAFENGRLVGEQVERDVKGAALV